MKLIDLVGQKFGRLTVIKRVDNNKFNQVCWECKCDCGKIITVTYGHLKNNDTKSCGCLHKERARNIKRKYNIFDLSGLYGIGYTVKGEKFYFDLEDYDKIKNNYWTVERGYILTYSDGKEYRKYLHRYLMDCPNDMLVDHINHITYDNRKNNLRIVTSSYNNINKTPYSDSKSGITGVRWNNINHNWRATITINKKIIDLGSYINIEDAIKARQKAEEKYFGEYSYNNSVKNNNYVR